MKKLILIISLFMMQRSYCAQANDNERKCFVSPGLSDKGEIQKIILVKEGDKFLKLILTDCTSKRPSITLITNIIDSDEKQKFIIAGILFYETLLIRIYGDRLQEIKGYGEGF